jgi:1L-myo-inositol 1-phosphate cytidylyltransferase
MNDSVDPHEPPAGESGRPAAVTMARAPDIVAIIAAGTGSRLRSEKGPPKPLRELAGRALILRVLDRFAEAGVARAVVVVGYRADEVRAGVEAADPPLPVAFVENPRFLMSNGLSVLAARPAVGARPFFLSMADHVFETSLIRGLAAAPLPADGLVLAVDRKLEAIYDMDDATKVRTADGRIAAIGKELPDFDAVDTGLFACTPALFEAIAAAAARRADGDCSLSDGVSAMVASGRARVHDIGPGRWQDVDTPGAVAHAEKLFG